MNSIDLHFQKLENSREKLMRIVRALSPEEYLKIPGPGIWSVGQIVNHLFLSEKLSLAYLKKKLSYPDTVPGFHFKSWIALWLLKIVLRSPYKAKAPKAINMKEGQPLLSIDDLQPEWDNLREELISYVKSRHSEFGSHLVYNHPYAGRLTMDQMLIFFNDHMNHHLRQIHRTLHKIRT